MKLALLSFLFVSISLFSKAQGPAKSIYVELGGPGLASVNYDMRFSGEAGIGGRIGAGGFSVDKSSVVFIPAAINYLFGRDNRNYFEVGAGATFVNVKTGFTSTYSGNSRVFHGTFGHLNFGYRLQPARGGFLFRADVTPVFGSGIFFPYFAGVSFGYKF